MSMNRVFMVGNLTKKPELRATKNGLSVASFSIAVTKWRKDQDDYVNYFDCSAFGKLAETIEKFTDKGSKVAINGELRQERWEKDGQKRSRVSIIVDSVEFMSKKEAAPANVQTVDFKPSDVQFVPVAEPIIDATVYDEDIPF